MGGGVVGVKRVRGRGVRGGCVCVWGGLRVRVKRCGVCG